MQSNGSIAREKRSDFRGLLGGLMILIETLKTSLIDQQGPDDDKQNRGGRQAVR